MKAIIVGTDGSDHGRRAVEWATEEAARRGLPLRILFAEAPWLYDMPVDPRAGAVRKWLLAGGREVLDQALGFAFEEASLRGARLRAVHAWSHPASAGPWTTQPLVYDLGIVAEEETRVLEESVAPWREKYPDVEVVAEAVHGTPVRILGGVSARADLLVVGTRGRGGFTGLLLGSVSHAVLHHAHCPVAFVPSVDGARDLRP